MSKKNGRSSRRAVRPTPPADPSTLLLTKPVQVNFSAQHKEAIQAAANAQGIALAQFIRQAAIRAASVKG